MLRFITVRSHKKGVRVNVQRRLEKKEDGKNSLHLGSFLISEGVDDELLKKLRPGEMIQLEGWLAEAEIASHYGVEPDSKEFIKRSFRVWQEIEAIAEEEVLPHAKRLGITFNPLKAALEAYYNAVINSANAIIRIEENKTLMDRFAEVGITLGNKRSVSDYQERLALESRILFKKLLELDQNKLKICREWEQCAKHYGKDKKISVGHLKEWAGTIPGHKPKELKKWYISVTIDVLLQYGINVVDLLPIDKLAEYWVHTRINHYTLDEARKAFYKAFQLGEDQKVNEAIEKYYKRITTSVI